MFTYILLFVQIVFGYYISKNGRFTKLCNALKTLPRDLHLTSKAIIYYSTLFYWQKRNYQVTHIFQKWAKKNPQKIAFRCGEQVMTFVQVEKLTNQLARYFKEECKLKRGDTVALYLPNSELYPCYWFALSKIGVISALINTNQVSKVLQHSIETSQAKLIIYDTAFTPALKKLGDFVKDFNMVHVGNGEIVEGSKYLWTDISNYSTEPLTEELNRGSVHDNLLYIYTSGTTGLPKAAIITHARMQMQCAGVSLMCSLDEHDVIYDTLPLYHSAGCVLGVAQTLLRGCTVVIRTKFSASNFWSDCIKYDCTAAQYIGEICRFLLSTKPSPKDRAHKVRLIYGNGFRQQIWNSFVKRFNIKDVGEFYGSTEGNSNLVNVWNQAGAVGYIPWFAKALMPLELIRVDDLTLEPVRDPATGLCIPCEDNEPGLCVGKIIKRRTQTHFTGYVDKEATKKKILYNVFSVGDMAVNSGDVLVRDELNYFYFKDRTGDTFRWRGENVSTTEVEAVISNIVGLKDATVYGVEIPGVEGRAGMVAIMDEERQLDMKRLEEGVMRELSSFARPLFLRIINNIPMTGTYKMQKNILQKEGYNPEQISDPLFFLDKGHYVKLDQDLYNRIVKSEIAL